MQELIYQDRGAYHEIEPIYAEMSKWVEENNYKPGGTVTVYEHYYNGPGFVESEMLTMIIKPLA
jgi:effector-binding domain-containing protein